MRKAIRNLVPWNLNLRHQMSKTSMAEWTNAEFEAIPKNVCVSCTKYCDGILYEIKKMSLVFSMVKKKYKNKNVKIRISVWVHVQDNDTAQKLVPVYKLQPIQLHDCIMQVWNPGLLGWRYTVCNACYDNEIWYHLLCLIGTLPFASFDYTVCKVNSRHMTRGIAFCSEKIHL